MMRSWMLVTMVCAMLLGLVAQSQPPAGGGAQRQPPKLTTVQGTVKAVMMPTDEQVIMPVRFTLATGDATQTVMLSTAKYLAKIGLTLKEGAAVTVNGWQIGQQQQAFLVRDLVIDGKTYPFRDEKGQPLWSNVEGLPEATADGKITRMITGRPGAALRGNRGAGRRPGAPPVDGRPERQQGQQGQVQNIAFVMETFDDNDTLVVQAGLAPLLKRLGLELKEGQEVSVDGWKTTMGPKKQTVIIARSITVDKKTYTLRDEKGFAPRPGAENKAAGNAAKPANGKGEDEEGDGDDDE